MERPVSATLTFALHMFENGGCHQECLFLGLRFSFFKNMILDIHLHVHRFFFDAAPTESKSHNRNQVLTVLN